MLLRYTFSFLIVLLSFNVGLGQSKKVNPNPERTVKQTLIRTNNLAEPRQLVADTIFPPIFVEDDCSLELFTFLNNQGWGFVAGQNSFIDLEKAQRFYFESDNYSVSEVFLYFATVDVVGDGNAFAKIYEIDETNNGPGELVGVSEPVRASALNVDPMAIIPTQFVFTTPAQVTGGEFFVSIELDDLYEAQDTISLLMTDLDCGIGGDAWELFGDGETWVSMADSASWLIQSNLFMTAIVESDGVSATKNLLVGEQNIRLHDAFPNPTKDELLIDFELEMAAEIKIEIYGVDGQLLQQIDKKRLSPGKYTELISTVDLSDGTYFYGIMTDKGRLMSKFVVGK